MIDNGSEWVNLKIPQPCDWCYSTCYNYEKGEFDKKKNMLNTLTKLHYVTKLGALMGVHAVPQSKLWIKVGDKVKIVEIFKL